MITATWGAVGVLVFLYIIGWLISYLRYSRNEAKHLGRIEGKVDGLGTRMESLEKRMGNLEQRLDGFISSTHPK